MRKPKDSRGAVFPVSHKECHCLSLLYYPGSSVPATGVGQLHLGGAGSSWLWSALQDLFWKTTLWRAIPGSWLIPNLTKEPLPSQPGHRLPCWITMVTLTLSFRETCLGALVPQSNFLGWAFQESPDFKWPPMNSSPVPPLGLCPCWFHCLVPSLSPQQWP